MTTTYTTDHVESSAVSAVTDAYIKFSAGYNTAVVSDDADLGFTVALEGIRIAGIGEDAANMAFDLVERFGAQWGADKMRALANTLGKASASTDNYVHMLMAVTIPGVKRRESEDWTVIRTAVNKVHKQAGASVTDIPQAVKDRVAEARSVKADATIGYNAVAKAIEKIATNAKERAERSPQQVATTTLKTILTNLQKVASSVHTSEVVMTPDMLSLVSSIEGVVADIRGTTEGK